MHDKEAVAIASGSFFFYYHHRLIVLFSEGLTSFVSIC
ncbi:hypothetical protein QY97_03028 [Bacillus thermotolerans]|uniref:Uncharacterized protein n=1 Tax=Bacillus thermotolerans TaxID=1221996 RepID=A0A0F5I3R8_BACTR|nr:hypothetical protein QY97_03028 [Bacillus thermotolerans]KKB40324.1 hypothetical protein QY95_01707 [Bacillus thermotolerans]